MRVSNPTGAPSPERTLSAYHCSVSQTNDVTAESASLFIGERFGSDASTTVKPLRGGDWSRAYSFSTDGRDLVVRFGKYRDDYEADASAVGYAAPGLVVPQVLEIGDAFGAYFAISEMFHGTFLEELGTDDMIRTLPALFVALDSLRAATPPDSLGPQNWTSWLTDSLTDVPGQRGSGWRTTLAKSPPTERLFDRGVLRLKQLADDCPQLRHVIHGDLLNRNVLVDTSTHQLAAVFDWGCTKAGDFLYEIAWFTFWGPWHDGLKPIDFGPRARSHYESIGLDVPNFDERIQAYELQIALEHIAYNAFTGRTGPDAQRLEAELSSRLDD